MNTTRYSHPDRLDKYVISTQDAPSPYRLGKLLGDVHAVFAWYCVPKGLPIRRYEASSKAISDLKDLRKQASATVWCPRSIISAMQRKIDSLEGLATDAEGVVKDVFNICRQVVHGDFQPRNILYDAGSDRIALIDLESMQIAPRVWDVVRACSYLFESRLELSLPFVRGYHSANPLTEVELNAMVSVWLDYLLKSQFEFRSFLSGRMTESGALLKTNLVFELNANCVALQKAIMSLS